MPKNSNVSITVIKRLPRYYRYLEELMQNGIQRISSKELAEIMNLTASQIRQDLNCFGGFGQQGYGYNVADLFWEIGKILGIERRFKIIIIGAGNLGRTISMHIDFDHRGFSMVGMFEKDEKLIGTDVHGHTVKDIKELESFCAAEKPIAVALCVPKQAAEELVPKLIALGVKAFWNFSHFDIDTEQNPGIISENIHLGDSMMTLCYQVKEMNDKDQNN